MQRKAQALERLADLWDLISQSDDVSERISAEYCQLRDEMKKEFMPWVEKLAKAGLLTMHLKKESLAEARQWARELSPVTGKLDSIAFEVIDAFDNGSIWLEAGPVSMAAGDQIRHQNRN